MPMEHFRDLVIQAKCHGAETISIFGYGEPLCDKDIVRNSPPGPTRTNAINQLYQGLPGPKNQQLLNNLIPGLLRGV